MTNRISHQISFFAPAAVMSAWAVVMLHTVATGHINRLLSPLFRNYVIVAAVLLILLSALYIFSYQPNVAPTPAFAPTGRLRQFGRWLVLIVPLLAAATLSPSALSSTTLKNRTSTNGALAMPSYGTESRAKAKEALDADPSQPVPVEVTELITLSRSPDQAKAFDGRVVKTVGLLVSQPGQPVKIVRWMMWCCAADALPAAVELTGNTSGQWTDAQWLEVTGKAKFSYTQGHATPRIEVESIKPTDEPDEPYLSP